MTFKNISFQDSETMRSLVKVAYEKGLLKEDSDVTKIVKKASTAAQTKRLDLTPSEDVKENLLKLCAGLRAKGFAAYASKIEDRVAQLLNVCMSEMNDLVVLDNVSDKDMAKMTMLEKAISSLVSVDYNQSVKTAEPHMYNVHDETGDDLLEFAHPEGDPVVAPAEDDNGKVHGQKATQEKILEIVQKKSAATTKKAQIIKAVEEALGTSFLAQAAARTPEQAALYEKKLDLVSGVFGQLYSKLQEVAKSDRRDRAQRIFLKCNEWVDQIRKDVVKGDRDLLARFLTDRNSPLDEAKKYCAVNIESDRTHSIADSIASEGVFATADDGETAKKMITQAESELRQILWNVDNARNGELLEGPGKIEGFKKPKAPEVPVILGPKNAFMSAIALANDALEKFLAKEEALYKPIPDSDTNKISIFDQAFDRAESAYKDYNKLYNDIDASKDANLTKSQLEALTKKYNIFRAKSSFGSKDEFSAYLNAVYNSIAKAVGLIS